jgi:hypothetical protein
MELAEAERRLGVQLPGAVREWYSYENGVAILAEHSNGDPPLQVRDFILLEWKSRRLLPIRNENQGVCVWAVELDGSDDPGVWIDVGADGTHWSRLASSFSVYVFTCIWDYRRVLQREPLVQAQNGPLSGAALEILRRRFREEPQTRGWPGSVQYRFEDGSGAILIWASEDRADWFIGAETGASLERAISAVWPLDGVGPELHGCSTQGKNVLAALRGRV